MPELAVQTTKVGKVFQELLGFRTSKKGHVIVRSEKCSMLFNAPCPIELAFRALRKHEWSMLWICSG